MSVEFSGKAISNIGPAAKTAWCVWLIFILIIIFFVGHHRTASISLWEAANRWITCQPLYHTDGGGFIYLPQSAAFYTLLVKLPFAWSEALWRIFSLSIFAWGLFRFTALLARTQSQRFPEYFLLTTVLSILLCFDSARNGQTHLLMTGLLMLAAVAITRKQWPKATFLITFSFFLKPTAIVFLLLVAGVFYAETWLYFLLWGGLGMLLPFLTQSSSYVYSQFKTYISILTAVANKGSAQDWAQFFNLISQAGWEVSHFLQTIVRVSVALIVLYLGHLIKKRGDLTETALWLLMLAMIYLMLFNPRTENNDYMMLTPVLSYCLVNCLVYKKFYRLSFLIPVTLGLVGSYYISNLFPGHRHWASPLMGVLLLGYLIFLICSATQPCIRDNADSRFRQSWI